MLTTWLAVVAALALVKVLLELLWRSTTYWKDRGVPQLKPLPFFGNYLPLLTMRKNTFDIYKQLYNEFPNEPMVGMYEFTNPILVLRDPKLIEHVLIRDFNSYPDHGSFIFEPASSLHYGLFNLYGDRWRALRNELLSTFSTGRMRTIHPGMVETCEKLLKGEPKTLDRESISQFAVDSFLRSLFGTELQPRGEKEFRENVRVMFQSSILRYFQQQFLIFYPRLGNWMNFKYMPDWMDKYFRSVVNTIVDIRESQGVERKDFTDVLLRLRSSKVAHIFDRENVKTDKQFELTNDLMVCQGFMFFFAGMDTTSLVMLYTAFELASNPGAQAEARAEVREAVRKHGGLTFDAIRDMKYMEQCIQEALRIHPALVFVMRITDRPTTLGGVQLEKGTRIIIPNYCLQMDPDYFPDPTAFKPDRFHKDSSRNKFAHLPFGEGPRVCVGKKFSIIEITTLFAHLLQEYEMSVDPQTKLPLEYQQTTTFLTPKHPVVIKLNKLSN